MKQIEILNIAIDCLTQQVKDKKEEVNTIETKLADLIKDREDITGKVVSISTRKKAANA